MATMRHPKTGVELNMITVRKTHLTEEEEETARLLRAEGDDYHIIAAKFGINQGRIAELLGGGGEPPGPPPPSPQTSMDL